MPKRSVFVILLFVLVSSVIALNGDFDNNGEVDFQDYLKFANRKI